MDDYFIIILPLVLVYLIFCLINLVIDVCVNFRRYRGYLKKEDATFLGFLKLLDLKWIFQLESRRERGPSYYVETLADVVGVKEITEATLNDFGERKEKTYTLLEVKFTYKKEKVKGYLKDNDYNGDKVIRICYNMFDRSEIYSSSSYEYNSMLPESESVTDGIKIYEYIKGFLLPVVLTIVLSISFSRI